MSDYFGSLIRSSSLAVGAAGSPSDNRVRLQPDARNLSDAPPVASDIVEIHEERTAPPIEPQPRAPASEPLAAAATERVVTSERPPDVTTPAVNTSAGVTSNPPPAVAMARPRHEPASEQSTPEPVRRAPDPVRLAMEWVASDPASRIIGAQRSIEDAAARTTLPLPQESVVFTEAAQVVREPVRIETSHRDRANEPVRERAMVPPVLAHPPARAVSGHVERVGAPSTVELPHEEVVEISIGAINLHVDAPAPQTIVQAAPPAHPQLARERAARSSLSRRYLRSF